MRNGFCRGLINGGPEIISGVASNWNRKRFKTNYSSNEKYWICDKFIVSKALKKYFNGVLQ